MNQVLIYRGTLNLGDAVQTVALSRLLDGPLVGVYRDAARRQARPEVPLVVNGWLGDEPPEPGGNCVFAGVHLGRRVEKHVRWLAGCAGGAGEPGRTVGSRDPETHRLLAARGVRSEMVGCATLTFERYAGPRSGRLAVDAGPRGPAGPTGPAGGAGVESDPAEGVEAGAERLTNYIPPSLPWPAQWAMALRLLDRLRRAEVVYTSRLHVALPCLAFGTPVLLRRRWRDAAFQPARLSLLDELGFEYDRPFTADVSAAAGRYLRFLSAALNRPVTPLPPRIPVVAAPPVTPRGGMGPSGGATVAGCRVADCRSDRPE